MCAVKRGLTVQWCDYVMHCVLVGCTGERVWQEQRVPMAEQQQADIITAGAALLLGTARRHRLGRGELRRRRAFHARPHWQAGARGVQAAHAVRALRHGRCSVGRALPPPYSTER